MSDDGLLDDSSDLEWIINTSSLLSAPETYLLSTRVLGWSLDSYETWLRDTLTRLARATE
jgi:hypothetical protein